MDEEYWKYLCHKAWIEEDPVELLATTLEISKFLGQKQQRLDTEAYERERKKRLN
jgi:hypothetical protein